jgi:hypothetical protein
MKIVIQVSAKRAPVNAWRALLYQDASAKFYILGMAICLRDLTMDLFWTVVIILVVLWAIGFFAFSGIFGWFIHLLLVIAVIVVIYRLLTGRNVVTGAKN